MFLSTLTLLGLGAAASLAVLLLFVAIGLFEVIMFVDAIRHPALENDRKLLWLVGMLLIHPFIAIAYHFTDHQKA